MQDIRQTVFWYLMLLVVICLIVWAKFTAIIAMAVFSLAIVLYFFKHIFWLQKLLVWLKKPELEALPAGTGVWEDVFSGLYHYQRRHQRNQAQLNSTLDRFMHAASALPDGVVLLNIQHHIEWCNAPAEKLLGLSLLKDMGQRIVYLIRHADFVDYLAECGSTEPIKLRSWINPDIVLEIQLVSFGNNQKLLIARDVSQVEKLEHMRRDFIANVSHELRTPLTVVGGFLETLTDMDDAVPEHLRGYFGMMQDQTARMRTLIEDLLTLSQLESSSLLQQDADIDVPALLNKILSEANSLSNGRHEIAFHAETDAHLSGSLQELHSAMGNLVSNAIRYTPDGGKITMTWKMRGLDAVFSVQDTGIGIEQKHIDRLTERFYRVDRSRSRETGGTGLGLSIVKHILTRHQGRLEVESEYGKGSVFSAVFSAERVVNKDADKPSKLVAVF